MRAAIQAKELTEREKDCSPSDYCEASEFAGVGCGVVVPYPQPLDVSVGDDPAPGKRLGIAFTVPIPEENEKLSNDAHLVWTER